MNLKNKTDADLVEILKNGPGKEREESILLLFNRHWIPIYAWVYNKLGEIVISESIVEEIFLTFEQHCLSPHTVKSDAYSIPNIFMEMAKRIILAMELLKDAPEKELAQEIQKGNITAFRVLFLRYQSQIYTASLVLGNEKGPQETVALLFNAILKKRGKLCRKNLFDLATEILDSKISQ